MRPLTEAERRARRDSLADQAALLFAETGWARLTIDAVAQGAGVSKGSVFLSFASKEDLVLHAVGRSFEAWFDRLEALAPRRAPADLAQDLLGSLRADPLLLPFLALVGPILEQGSSAAAVVAFKETLARRLARLSEAWGRALPEVAAGAWGPLFLQVYALIVGAWSVGETSDAVRGALADRPDLAGLLTRFEDLFLPLMEARLHALFQTPVPGVE